MYLTLLLFFITFIIFLYRDRFPLPKLYIIAAWVSVYVELGQILRLLESLPDGVPVPTSITLLLQTLVVGFISLCVVSYLYKPNHTWKMVIKWIFAPIWMMHIVLLFMVS